ncbi:MAG: hypothetical protein KKG60_00530 [Nanoarchaeota archaeon]|nr:hypothetical protein [Nanoarchaeota archaeon]
MSIEFMTNPVKDADKKELGNIIRGIRKSPRPRPWEKNALVMKNFVLALMGQYYKKPHKGPAGMEIEKLNKQFLEQRSPFQKNPSIFHKPTQSLQSGAPIMPMHKLPPRKQLPPISQKQQLTKQPPKPKPKTLLQPERETLIISPQKQPQQKTIILPPPPIPLPHIKKSREKALQEQSPVPSTPQSADNQQNTKSSQQIQSLLPEQSQQPEQSKQSLPQQLPQPQQPHSPLPEDFLDVPLPD